MAEETRMQEQVGLQDPNGQAQETGTQEPEITVESLSAENAKLKAEFAKQKLALDKALHNNGELTKQLRAKMSAQEQEDDAKRQEAEAFKAHMADLENFKKRTEARDRYMTMGMTAELAKEAAEAEVEGDMDALTAVYKRYNDASIKAHREEWMKSRPEPAASRDEDREKEDPFLVGFNKQ